MFTIIIGAIVSLLVFFFEQWWQKNHPITPTAEHKEAFLCEVGKWKHCWMGSKRKQYASALFDKFQAKYEANPTVLAVSDKPLSKAMAHSLASAYCVDLTLSKDEADKLPNT